MCGTIPPLPQYVFMVCCLVKHRDKFNFIILFTEVKISFLGSAPDSGEWLASLSGRFNPSAHWIGGWVGPRAVLDAAVKRIIPGPCRESNPTTPIVQPVAQRYTDWAITALIVLRYPVTNSVKCLYLTEWRLKISRGLYVQLFFLLVTADKFTMNIFWSVLAAVLQTKHISWFFNEEFWFLSYSRFWNTL
jgi:hypothetical protein